MEESVEIHQTLVEALAVQEMLRTLGFPPDDIFVAYYPDGIFVVLKTQGKELSVSCGEHPNGCDDLEFEKMWRDTVNAWNNTLTDDDMRQIIDRSKLRDDAVGLLGAIVNKGISIPANMN
jgi:hypothetical protein